jgi:hypothetical protein
MHLAFISIFFLGNFLPNKSLGRRVGGPGSFAESCEGSLYSGPVIVHHRFVILKSKCVKKGIKYIVFLPMKTAFICAPLFSA